MIMVKIVSMMILIMVIIISLNHWQVGWQSLVVLYEHDEGLVRLQELLRLPQVIFINSIGKIIFGKDI